ncbi:phosphoenolpyruvate carboxykinase (ATP) [Salegentibacter sp. F188]|uniref:Phosphoenolpyruvate carboxykinase (ATP) n=1 Tax=Autumnicola patrickiae TaxID=3075591 RepID=A0ABU3E502_9FLAO|nr:phosphoenolpyruvate carboxykinase (ATP) [Salegentibacter sp. F188]MDT0690988.1 phosphoenolpyruvate carboxykinase (ATP) [Salegentibacter sp. F188]
MENLLNRPKAKNLKKYGLSDNVINWNLSGEELQKITIEKGMGRETANGTLAVNTGKFTGRSPQDRFLVRDDYTSNVWWGKINKPISPENFNLLYDRVADYLSGKEVYVHDGYVCAYPEYRLDVRTITEYPWSNFFVKNMFLRLNEEELKNFEEDWLILCAPGYIEENPEKYGLRQGNFSILNFTRKIALVGGSAYAGEMKKGIFSALNLILPTEKNVLPMHCSANVGQDGDTAIFFGLSGTGKTTLSADPERKLIGDDEHGWTPDDVIFNFEGGCYAKVIGLTEESEPDIYRAIKPGAMLENVVFNENTGEVDFFDTTITQNTRVSYPIDHIDDIQEGSYAGNPKNIFFLTCDAFGVLPPVSKLTPGQAAYHFISGYTAKVAGTEAGINEPVPSFSACFGEPFMPLHPTAYAEMLSKKMQESNVNVWLINTGWSGGPYGVGSRIKLKYTRRMISEILNGNLQDVDYEIHPIFGLKMPRYCHDVPSEMLNPINTWLQKGAYIQKSIQLAHSFHLNFEKFAEKASKEIVEGGPLIDEHHKITSDL